MAGQYCIEGLAEMSDAVFKDNAIPEDKELILFSNDFTITDATVNGDLTEITTNGGEKVTMAKGTWDAATEADPVVSVYNGASGITFSITGNLTVYGWAVKGVTSDKIYGAEDFGIKTFVNGNTFICAPISLKLDIPE